MKHSHTLFVSILVLVSLMLTACGATVAPTAPQSRADDTSAQVEFVGRVEAIKDNQWTINGQVVEVSAELTKGLTFQVGDEVNVSAIVNKDGSVKAQRIVTPGVNDDNGNSNNSNSNDDNGNNSNSNDDNGNDDNGNDDNGNDDNGNDDNSNDDNGNDYNGNDDNSNDYNGNDDNSNDDNGNSNDDNSNDDDDDDGDDDDDD